MSYGNSQVIFLSNKSLVITFFLFLFIVPGSSLYSAIDPDSSFFRLALRSSEISSALGLAHILKNGVGRVLGNGGGCDGMCAGQFILVFFACFPTNYVLWLDWILSIFFRGYLTKIQTSLLILSYIVIQLCFSLFLTIGWSKKSAKTILKQPTLILLPIFTFFTFAKMSVCCREEQNFRLKLSKRYTVINFVMKTLIIIPVAVIYFKVRNDYEVGSAGISWVILNEFPIQISIYFFGALLTFIFLFCTPSCGCCCSCCVSGQQVIHVYDPDLPDQEFIFRNGEVIRKDQDSIELEEK